MSQYFDYLEDLRESGETNMWGASTYLEAEFGLDAREAKDILLAWIKTKYPSPNKLTSVDN